ncbi:MAG: MBL fold metallo-hydrolase [Desulfovibrio sp.]|jgi:glyoxylase-like metal-dependent hydrolase (beta-lactamase superfamily II)|nr:MBL fold metallo-hydrolase [Desulfovibrio sp.]
MRIIAIPLGPLDTNCYVAHSDEEAVVIDPGGSPEKVTAYLDKHRLTLTRILLSHLHFDHTYGVAALAGATGAPVLASPKDGFLLEGEGGKGGMWGLPLVEAYTYDPLTPGRYDFLGLPWDVLATPGHTPGGLSFFLPAARSLFSGDALFRRSIGRTDFPGSDHEQLIASIKNVLFALPDDTVVYPGHGDATSIGDEKRNNPYVSDFV